MLNGRGNGEYDSHLSQIPKEMNAFILAVKLFDFTDSKSKKK